MKYDEKLDQSLKDLDKDIIWNKKRQKHVRNKLINNMRQSKTNRVSQGRKKVLPIFSIIFMIAIVTIIALSEFNTTDIATSDNLSQRTSGGKGNKDTQIVGNDDEQHSSASDNKATHENEAIEDKPSNTNDPPENNVQDRLLTQAEIMEAIKGQMTTDLPLKLPKEITLPEGKHLTAITSADTNSYEVTFYQHDEPIPINNKRLFSADNPAEVIARVHVEKYDTQKQADDAIAYETFNEHMGEPIKLSEGLTGYQEAGAGSVWTNWNVGRWALTTQARSNDSEQGVSLAKEVITYLEEYMLPAPKQHGYAHLDAEHEDNQIVWGKETTIYTIDQINDPLKALEIAVNFE